MTHVLIEKATPELASRVTLRPADCLELERASGLGPQEALVKSIEASDGNAWALSFNGRLAAFYGLCHAGPIAAPVGVPWLLTTKYIEADKKLFLTIARDVVVLFNHQYPLLVQMVDAEYAGALSFMRRIGFELHPPVVHGVAGALFVPATRTLHV